MNRLLKVRLFLATLFVACAMIGVSATAEAGNTQQKADTYPTYSVRACQTYQGEQTGPDGRACLKVWYKKQEDGTGINNKTRRIGMWTAYGDGSISSNCGAYFNNPAVKYSSVSVYLALSRYWGPATGEPTDGNGCFVQWNTDVGVNGAATTVWEFKPDINGGLDGNERRVSITVAPNGSWDCNVSECDRDGPF